MTIRKFKAIVLIAVSTAVLAPAQKTSPDDQRLLMGLLLTAADYTCKSGRTRELWFFNADAGEWQHFVGESYSKACAVLGNERTK